MKRFALRLPDDVYAQLRADAAHEGRTMHAQILHLLRDGKHPPRKGGRKAAATAEDIMALLRRAGRPVSTQELAEHFGCHPLTLKYPLWDMLRAGTATRQYRRYLGYYYQPAAA